MYIVSTIDISYFFTKVLPTIILFGSAIGLVGFTFFLIIHSIIMEKAIKKHGIVVRGTIIKKDSKKDSESNHITWYITVEYIGNDNQTHQASTFGTGFEEIGEKINIKYSPRDYKIAFGPAKCPELRFIDPETITPKSSL